METIVERITKDEESNSEIYEKAGRILRNGGLVAFPTETVYGLGGNALDTMASGKIYAAKGRPSDNPLIVHIADEQALEDLCENIPDNARKLAKVFWPGPLTMIMNKKSCVPESITGGLNTVAIRMPNHPVALELIRKSGIYIAAPSANTSGRPSPTRAEHVYQDLNGKIDMIIDGGSVEIGIESTIVDLSEEHPVILRPGYITKEMLEEVVGSVEIDKAIIGQMNSNAVPKAPGMKYKHYAPKGELFVVENETLNTDEKVIDKINQLAAEMKQKGYKTGILATDATVDKYKADIVISVGNREDEISVSSQLFASLRRFDDEGVDYIYSEGFSTENVGMAIMNRLMKAAGGKLIKV